MLSGQIFTYKTGGGGLVDQMLELETSTPLAQSSFKFSHRPLGQFPNPGETGAYSADSRYKARTTYAYDTRGNPSQITPTSGPSTSYLWGYNGRYPVAEAVNASLSDIAYSDFESDAKGNWTYAGSAVRDWTSPTGKYAYNLTAGSVQKTGLTAARRYLLTYWAKSSSATGISGGTATAVRTKGAWTQYRRVVSGVTSVTVSGTVAVDDLRLHPFDAQMSTYTYDPLIGMTSQTDGAGKMLLYFYDDFGRLQLVKDLDGNIVETYCYNYRGDVIACSGTVYFNAAKSGTFTRNNCGTGGQGGAVTYSVPAGAYVSMISQADADQRAQADVTANGQAYANQVGTCTASPVSVTITRDMGWTGRLGRITFNRSGGQAVQVFPSNSGPEETIQVPAGFYTSVVFDITETEASAYSAYLSFLSSSGSNPCVSLGYHSANSSYTVTLQNVDVPTNGSAAIWVSEYCQ